MLCFNDNYVLPAGVAIWSLLHHANRSCTYPSHVVHSDITQEHQERLRKTVAKFPNASIDFMQTNAVLDDLWAATKGKFSFSKDVYCKMLVGDLFPQYQRILITDVDVIFMGDIAPLFKKGRLCLRGHSRPGASRRVPLGNMVCEKSHPYASGAVGTKSEPFHWRWVVDCESGLST